MSKEEKKEKKCKRATHQDDVFRVLRDLQPGERIVEPPPVFASDFRFSRQAACRSVRRYGVLRDGVLHIYASRHQADKNRLWRMVDLTKCVIMYRMRDRAIMVEMTERYRLKVRKQDFARWVDNLRSHRLYGQMKQSSTSVPASDEPTKMTDAIGPTPAESTAQMTQNTALIEPKVLPLRPIPTAAVAASKLTSKTAAVPKQMVMEQRKLAAPTAVPKTTARAEPVTKRVKSAAKEPAPAKKPAPIIVEEETPERKSAQPVAPERTSAVAPVERAAVQLPPPAATSSTSDERKEPPSPSKDSLDSEGSEDSGEKVCAPVQEKRHSSPFRTTLPAVMCPPPSLIRLIMSAIGRDIMRMALPTVIMVPLSSLQILCEEFEYANLIEQAVANSDPQWRMLYVTALAMSSYSSTAFRASRKPFNPLLGETFEFVHPTQGWRFVAEQVNHHPPVAASYAEGPGWKFWQDLELIASLSTSALKATPLGMVQLKLEKWQETYTWNRVITYVYGILSGRYVIDNEGQMTITCKKTKLTCKMDFKRMTSTRRGDVDARVMNENGNVVQYAHGNWTEAFFVGERDDANPNRIWTINAMPDNYERYYGLTKFALALNEMRPDIHGVLPKTDCRFRPDQRALENGKVNESDRIKRELEEKQRERRRANEAKKIRYKPLWFKAMVNKDPNAGSRWKFNGKYWLAKEEEFTDNKSTDLW